MGQYLSSFAFNLFDIIMPFSVFLATLTLGFIFRKILFSRLLHWASKTKSQLDDIVISAVKGPFIIWCIMLGIYFALKTTHLSSDIVIMAGKVLLVLWITSITIVLSHIAKALITLYSGKIESAMPVTSLTQNISRIVIFVVGSLMALNSLGISITPILATLGVGGLAVALALQDTLSNFFSGFHIIAARQIKVGDYIKLDSGQEGYVTDINWRTTKIKLGDNNVVLVPNIKLIQSIIINFYLPDKEMNVLVNLGVHYKSDLNKVEKVTCEVAKEIMKDVPGGVPAFNPVLRYNSFGDSSVNFAVVLRVKEFVDQYFIKHEFIKRLHERYNKEGIIIPYPVRAVNYEQEKEGG